MSAGKSTLINALLGKKLMPSKNGACTATITKIKDDDDDTFKADAYDSNRNKIAHHSILDYKIMSCLNKNPDVSEINVSGNIPFVASNETSLILIDTPGPDNARDKNHGLVTAKALDQSSKMLVLFVMNGSKLHDEAQDAFLKRIAKSMSVGGKQARERFLFVINKLDAYDEEDDDIAGETIPDTIQYLDEMGIKNPNIFPAAAYPALLIRRYQSTHDEGEKQKILRELEPLAEKLVEQKQLHLEQYPNLAYSCQAQIDAELQEAIKNNDILGQALIHSGIRGIEETIRMYVTKYCRPLKIKTLVDTFKDGLDSAEAFEQTKHEIASREKEQEKLQEQTRRAIRDSLYELELILEDKRRRNRTELYEPFFFRRENKAVMLQEAYVSGLIDLLEKYPVKRKVYLTLQKIYSGSGAESAKVLIRYLEQKNKKETPNVWGAAAFAAIGIGQLQGICGEEWKSSFSTMLMLIVVILGLGILYAGLRTHYSVGISQIWIAGILFWLSFLGLITTISDNLFWDADTGIFLAVMVWFESIIWMVILGIRAIVLKIKNRR